MFGLFLSIFKPTVWAFLISSDCPVSYHKVYPRLISGHFLHESEKITCCFKTTTYQQNKWQRSSNSEKLNSKHNKIVSQKVHTSQCTFGVVYHHHWELYLQCRLAFRKWRMLSYWMDLTAPRAFLLGWWKIPTSNLPSSSRLDIQEKWDVVLWHSFFGDWKLMGMFRK